MRILTIALLLILSGCASYQAGIAAKGAEVADELLTTAEWQVCYAASVGSIKRRYGMTVERANLYKEFCSGAGAANVVGPIE